jgi:hypothetical protein
MRNPNKPARTNHPLLLYRRLFSYYGWPSAWLLVVSAGLLVWNPPPLADLRLALSLAALLAAALLLFTFVLSRLARVQCGEDGVLVQAPLYRLHVPYESIVRTRTSSLGTVFPPSQQPFSSRAFLDPLWLMPVVVVEVEALPRSRRQLRLWMDSRMLLKSALVLLVEDHGALRGQIDEAMIRWRVAKRGT